MGGLLVQFSEIAVDTVFKHKGLKMVKKNEYSANLFGGGTFFMAPDDEIQIDTECEEGNNDTH